MSQMANGRAHTQIIMALYCQRIQSFRKAQLMGYAATATKRILRFIFVYTGWAEISYDDLASWVNKSDIVEGV